MRILHSFLCRHVPGTPVPPQCHCHLVNLVHLPSALVQAITSFTQVPSFFSSHTYYSRTQCMKKKAVCTKGNRQRGVIVDN